MPKAEIQQADESRLEWAAVPALFYLALEAKE
jgi:hypothetical protein